MTEQEAQAFASEWIAAWNAHDLDAILGHYDDDFVMSSPFIAQLTNNSSGTLHGKRAVGNYWATALERYPELHFELLHVLRGAASVTLIYQGVGGLSAEVFRFGADGSITEAAAHYL